MDITPLLLLVPWLFVLACPLMMWWMMRGTSGGRCGPDEQVQNHGTTGDERDEIRGPDEQVQNQGTTGDVRDEIRRLRRRVAELEGSGPARKEPK